MGTGQLQGNTYLPVRLLEIVLVGNEGGDSETEIY